MKIAYFINQYPKVSHTFIRREIVALESLGVQVARCSLRSNISELVDPADLAEAKLTNYLLDINALKITAAFTSAIFSRPLVAVRTFWLATQLGWQSDRGILRHFAYLLEAYIMADLCKRQGIKHIHAHFGTNSATVAMLASELSNLTFSFTAHGADELNLASSAEMTEKLSRASFVVGVSWYVRSQLLRNMHYDSWNKVKVIHCGLGPDFLECPTPALPSAPRVVCVGRLCKEKAQLLLIEAARKLKDRRIEFVLVLAGDGPLRPEIERAIASNGLNEQIYITGWISNEQVKHELSSARALVLPSLIEGLPVVIMEAMALARPVVSTFIAGIPELVLSDKTGWLVPAGDSDALADKMALVLAKPLSELKILGKAGQIRVRERHDVKTEALKLKRLFEELIQ